MNTRHLLTNKVKSKPLPQINKHIKNRTDIDLFFQKMTNLIMIHGKKIKASKHIFNMLLILKTRIKRQSFQAEHYDKTLRNQESIRPLEKSRGNLDSKRIKNTLRKKPVIKAFQHQFTRKLEKFGTKDVRLHFTLFHLISKALGNIIPSLEVRKVRVSGSTYNVPAVLSKKKQETLALKWLIDSARKRQNNSNLGFATCLADEFMDAYKKLGQARQRRDDFHRLAQMNRAYIRYRWW